MSDESTPENPESNAAEEEVYDSSKIQKLEGLEGVLKNGLTCISEIPLNADSTIVFLRS